MIYYLSSEKNRERFDFIKESDDEFIVSAGGFDLKEKLLKRGGGLEHCTTIIIDHTAVSGKTRDVANCLQSFRLMYPIKIVYFYEGANPGDGIYSALVDARIYNIITSTEPGNIAVEYAQCMTGRSEGEARTGRASAEKPVARKTYHVSGFHAAVFGTEPKSGCTFTAFGLAGFLADAGIRAGYVEIADKSRKQYLPQTAASVLVNESDEALEANILDLGVVDQKKVNVAGRFQKFILCAGHQPWQLDALSDALFKLTRVGYPVDIVFQPVYDAVKPQLLAKYTGKTVAVHFAEFAPDLGDQGANRGLFEALVRAWETV